jgi:hypothetical protein
MLSLVAGCCQHVDAHVAHADRVAVVDWLMVELQTSVGAGTNAGTGDWSKLAPATEKVVMDVRLEHVADPSAFGLSHVDVLVDIAQRVDERGHSGSLGNYQVRGVAQTWLEELVDFHDWITASGRSGSRGIKLDREPGRAPLRKTQLEAPYLEAVGAQDASGLVGHHAVRTPAE